MSSVAASVRQVSPNTGYFINVASAVGKVYSYNTTAGAQTFSTATWAANTLTGAGTSRFSTVGATAGGALLKDMGKTVVSSGRTFRKVQFVYSTVSTGSVGGVAPTTLGEDYFTGYIELGFDPALGVPSPFACYGR